MTNKILYFPVAIGCVKLLPKNKVFSEGDAIISLQADNFHDNEVTITGYAKMWMWSVGKVYRFFDKMGVEIKYPEDTKDLQKQRGKLVMKRNENGHENGMMFFIDIKELRNKAECKRNENESLLTKRVKSKDILTSKTDQKDGVPHDQILDLYHAILPELPRVRVWTKKRKAMLGVRWQEDKKRQSLDWWKGYFEHVHNSKFLMGENSDFQANMEWLINASNIVKVIEGVYHR